MSQNQTNLSNDSMDSTYFRDMSNLMRNANDSSFLVHVDDNKQLPEAVSNVSSYKQDVNWDEMDLALRKNPETKFGTFPPFPDLPPPTNQDVDESQFISLNPDEARHLFDMDGEDRLRLNDSNNAASFLNPPNEPNSFNLPSPENPNETMGKYFYSKSSFPKASKENLSEDFISNFWAQPPPITEAKSNTRISIIEEPSSGFWRDSDLRLHRSQAASVISEPERESTETGNGNRKTEDRAPRASISRFSSFFKSSRAEGLDKNDIISHVMKYCKKQTAEEPKEYQRDKNILEDPFSQSLEPNMSGLVRTSQYDLIHSTPIKKSTQNLNDFSLKTMCATGTSLERDILPRLSQLPSEITSSIAQSRKRISSTSSKNNTNTGTESIKRYTQGGSQSIKIKSGTAKRHSESIPDVRNEQRKSHSAGQFQNYRINDSASSSRPGSTNQSLVTAQQTSKASNNTTNRSSATSTCSTSCSAQTLHNQPQGTIPMFGYPIIVQVQCPHHHGPVNPHQCNNNTQHSCSSQASSQIQQPWLQMPMMPMSFAQFPQHSMQPVQNCCSCQSTNSTASTVAGGPNPNDQTLAIESSSRSSTQEDKAVAILPPKRGLPKIHIDKPIIRWGPTDLHLGEYTTLTIVNESESSLFFRCGIIQNTESKHFKIVSETYDRKIQGISYECEIPEGDVKTISLVFTPEKEKRYLGELQIKCRYTNHQLLDGIFSCKLPLVGTGTKQTYHR